jgi:hypothetical protein
MFPVTHNKLFVIVCLAGSFDIECRSPSDQLHNMTMNRNYVPWGRRSPPSPHSYIEIPHGTQLLFIIDLMMTFARGRNLLPDDKRWQSVCCVWLETSIDTKEMCTAKWVCDFLYSVIVFTYCYPAVYYLFRVNYAFLGIFSAYMKRQIKIVPVCIGLCFKQI